MAVIVISGQPGCGSSTTAKLLAKKLKLKHFSVGDYNKSQAGASAKETDKSIIVWKKKKINGKGLQEFHEDSDELARDYAKKGDIVIDGKLAVRMTKGLYDLGVWLKAPKAVRAERYARRDKISLKDAMKKLREKEALERKNWLRIYGFDYFMQEREAGLVINTWKKTPEEIAKAIIKRLKEQE
ncbi:MAG: cytidylate kinase family protein [Candidatus Aenigmarchaeota archaeon]|nr:cytidylate kinase family protein [Candidatus Aenigmarchaeota archaeon]